MAKKAETEYVMLPGVVGHTTTKAVLHQTEDNGDMWVPRSVCRDGADIMTGDEDIHIAEWWLKKTGVQY